MQEIEVKFLNVDPEAIEAKLAAIGARKVGEYFYRRQVFDYPDWRLNADHSWLRLRDEGDQITLSFKKRLGVKADGGNDDGMEETEIIVSDFGKTAELFLRLGLVNKHYVENRRRRWQKDGVEFDLDFYPDLEPYLEIEAPSQELVEAAIGWLGLDPAEQKVFSTNQIYKLKGRSVADYTRITFEGWVKKDKK
ncbi:MAG: class IV adenylate cyclase [Patescibacteria group bacterium]|jgi:adenylate cyclase class 2